MDIWETPGEQKSEEAHARVGGREVDGGWLCRESLGFDPRGQALHTRAFAHSPPHEHRQTRTHTNTGTCNTKHRAHESSHHLCAKPRSRTWGTGVQALCSSHSPCLGRSDKSQTATTDPSFLTAGHSTADGSLGSALPAPVLLLWHFLLPWGPQKPLLHHQLSPLASAEPHRNLSLPLARLNPDPPMCAHSSHLTVPLRAVHTPTEAHVHMSPHTCTHRHTRSHTLTNTPPRFCNIHLQTRCFLFGSDPTFLSAHCHDTTHLCVPGWSGRGPGSSSQVHLLPPS